MRSTGRAILECGFVSVAVVLALTARSIRADVAVVAPDLPPATILVSDQETQSKLCSSTLAEYLKKITGQDFPVAYGSTTAQRVIEVVKVDPNAEPRLGKEAFIIEAAGNRVRLIGGSDQSRLYAVFEFLRLYGQARWWSYNEEDVPSVQSISVPQGRQVIRPTFDQYVQVNREAQYSFKPVDPSDKNSFRYKLRTQSILGYKGGHNLYPLLSSYGQTHPDIYPMDAQGHRAPNKLHFCYMADGIAEALAAAMAKEVEKRDGNITDWVYFAGMGDWYGGMCQCPRCKPIYEEETWTDPDGFKKPGYCATLLRMLNKTAGILKQKYPGIMLGTQAYMSLEAPPAKTRPADNVVILIPRLRHVTVRSVLEADELIAPEEIGGPSQNVELTDAPQGQAHVKASNRSFRRNLEQWLQLAPGRVRIWDYAASFNNFLLPFPCLRSMAENLKYYHKMGATGVLLQGSYTGAGSDMIVLKNYVLGRLLWDPNADTQALIKEFCDGYYGPAAAEAYAYVNALEDSVRKPVPINMSEWGDPMKLLTPALLDRLEAILKPGVDRSAVLTGQLLAFSRKQMLDVQRIDLRELVADISKMIPRLVGEDIRLAVVPASRPCLVVIDPGQLQQAIINLVTNARDAMAAGGELTIETACDELDADTLSRHGQVEPGVYASVLVRDTGCGMDKATLGRLFEPFFTTKEVGRGTGLGLSMAYGFAEQSGGFIDVQSQPGKGSTFTLYFPQYKGNPDAPADEAQPTPYLPRGDETILVVEDEESVRGMLVESLRECGYTVIEAHRAAEALKALGQAKTRIHLLITDVVMPEGSGLDLARTVARDHPEMKVLFISGYVGDELSRRGVVVDPGRVITKPCRHETLVRKVRSALDEE